MAPGLFLLHCPPVPEQEDQRWQGRPCSESWAPPSHAAWSPRTKVRSRRRCSPPCRRQSQDQEDSEERLLSRELRRIFCQPEGKMVKILANFHWKFVEDFFLSNCFPLRKFCFPSDLFLRAASITCPFLCQLVSERAKHLVKRGSTVPVVALEKPWQISQEKGKKRNIFWKEGRLSKIFTRHL